MRTKCQSLRNMVKPVIIPVKNENDDFSLIGSGSQLNSLAGYMRYDENTVYYLDSPLKEKK